MTHSLSGNFERSLKSSFLIFPLFIFSNCLSQNSFIVKVSSSNLSEDVSSLTTQNDELLLCVFEFIGDSINIISQHQFQLQSTYQEEEIKSSVKISSDSLYFFILEIDSDEPEEKIIDKIIYNKNVLVKAHFELNTRKIKEILNDKDVISARKIAVRNIHFNETGFHLFDKYSYQIQITTF